MEVRLMSTTRASAIAALRFASALPSSPSVSSLSCRPSSPPSAVSLIASFESKYLSVLAPKVAFSSPSPKQLSSASHAPSSSSKLSLSRWSRSFYSGSRSSNATFSPSSSVSPFISSFSSPSYLQVQSLENRLQTASCNNVQLNLYHHFFFPFGTSKATPPASSSAAAIAAFTAFVAVGLSFAVTRSRKNDQHTFFDDILLAAAGPKLAKEVTFDAHLDKATLRDSNPKSSDSGKIGIANEYHKGIRPLFLLLSIGSTVTDRFNKKCNQVVSCDGGEELSDVIEDRELNSVTKAINSVDGDTSSSSTKVVSSQSSAALVSASPSSSTTSSDCVANSGSHKTRESLPSPAADNSSVMSGGADPNMSGNGHEFHPMWRSEEKRPFDRKMEDALLFCGNSNVTLGHEVADRLSTKLGKVSVKRFADGEVSIQFLDSLRGKDVYIIQPTSPPVNEHLMELLLMVSTCRRASAKKITAVIPYYGYARQDRKLSSRVPISAADVARMIEAMGVDRVVAVDLHCGQIQGFFGPRVPVDNLEAQIIGLDYFSRKNLSKPVIVSPDAGGVYRARKFQEGLLARGFKECGLAMLIKQRACANEIERMDLVGSVDGSDVIIVDDMIDTAGTLCEAARELRKHGARRVFAFATHGLFSGPAIERIEASPLEEVIVTNTIRTRTEVMKCSRITTLSMSVLVADAIRRIHQKESLNDLFSVGA